MRTCTSLFLVSLAGLAVSCDSGGDASGSTGIETNGPTGTGTMSSGATETGPSMSSTSTSGAPPTESTGNDQGDDDDDFDPPISFDLGVTPDAGEFDDGCDAVDFLFVIDNSGSMGAAQDNLVANFPTFIEGIQNTLTDVESYHVGIIPTDDHNGFTASNPIGCRRLGALVTQTAGADSSNATCGPYTEGFNFITEADDLASAFDCAAQVGTDGSIYELTMNAMEAALSDDLNAEGACNEGFLRDDALLVVVVITDEADGPGDPDGLPPNYSSTGNANSWYQSVLAAKNDIPENAAALVLTNWEGGPCPPDFPGNSGANMVEFAGLFGENGFVTGICEPDYGPSFANATAIIEQACENFIPPG